MVLLLRKGRCWKFKALGYLQLVTRTAKKKKNKGFEVSHPLGCSHGEGIGRDHDELPGIQRNGGMGSRGLEGHVSSAREVALDPMHNQLRQHGYHGQHALSCGSFTRHGARGRRNHGVHGSFQRAVYQHRHTFTGLDLLHEGDDECWIPIKKLHICARHRSFRKPIWSPWLCLCPLWSSDSMKLMW